MHVLIVEDDASLGRGIEVVIRRREHRRVDARRGARATGAHVRARDVSIRP